MHFQIISNTAFEYCSIAISNLTSRTMIFVLEAKWKCLDARKKKKNAQSDKLATPVVMTQ